MNIKAENKDKKLEFNFSQEYLNKIVDNIKNQNIDYINKELNKLHPSDSAEVISNLSEQIKYYLISNTSILIQKLSLNLQMNYKKKY